MEKQLSLSEKSRFDAKIPRVQKELFEYAASLGGFRTLTDFIINAVQEKANAIIQEHNTILASEKDRELFFNALMNPPGPNQKLRDAAERYKVFMRENK
ncbi:MAG: type II toxin-antitoxin system TacA family antitoxin [Mucilaginibacter sp.]